MKITLESTDKIVEVNGRVQARIWEGTTERGVPCFALITRIAPSVEYPLPGELTAEFEADLRETRPPSEAVAAIPLRLVL